YVAIYLIGNGLCFPPGSFIVDVVKDRQHKVTHISLFLFPDSCFAPVLCPLTLSSPLPPPPPPPLRPPSLLLHLPPPRPARTAQAPAGGAGRQALRLLAVDVCKECFDRRRRGHSHHCPCCPLPGTPPPP